MFFISLHRHNKCGCLVCAMNPIAHKRIPCAAGRAHGGHPSPLLQFFCCFWDDLCQGCGRWQDHWLGVWHQWTVWCDLWPGGRVCEWWLKVNSDVLSIQYIFCFEFYPVYSSLVVWDHGLMTRLVSDRPRSWSYTFGLDLGLGLTALVLVLYFWSCFQHCYARQDVVRHDNAEM